MTHECRSEAKSGHIFTECTEHHALFTHPPCNRALFQAPAARKPGCILVWCACSIAAKLLPLTCHVTLSQHPLVPFAP